MCFCVTETRKSVFFCPAQLLRNRAEQYAQQQTVTSKTGQHNLCMDTANVSPSGGCSVGAVARTATACLQLVGTVMLQLLPDGLLSTHPCMRPANLRPYGSLALQSQPRDSQECNANRFAVVRALEELEGTTRREDFVFTQHANVWLRPALSQRRLALMRVFTFHTGTPDLGLLAYFVFDMPKLGWAHEAPGFLLRERPHNCTPLDKLGRTKTWTGHPGKIRKKSSKPRRALVPF